MGSITAYNSASGKRYRVRYRKPDHSQTQKRGFRTKRDAELYLADVELKKATGDFVDVSTSKETSSSLGQQWLSTQTQLKPSSLRPVEIAWRLYVQPVWGGYPAGQIRHSDVQAWVSELSKDRSATTVLRIYGVLAAILDVAVRDRRIRANAAREINLPRKVRKEHVYLSHRDVETLASNSGEHATLIFVLAYTGLRWGEATGLRVRDVNLERRRINVSVNAVEVGTEIVVGTPKTYKRRAVAFPRFIARMLADQCADKSPNSLVFPAADGDYLRRATRGTRTWFKSALKASNLAPMTIHDLRHTAASLAISAGANVKAVQRMLGHASAAMTPDVYADLFDDDIGAVADALDEAKAESIVAKTWPN
jgi:Site-specific recombinase XerD